MIRGIKRNFSGGEVAPTIPARDDLAKFSSSCIAVQNFIVQMHGGGRYRTGTRFVDEALGDAIFIPFEFNTDEEDMYQLIFTDQVIRFVQDDGYVTSGGSPYEVVSPYLEDDLAGIRFDQIGDVIYLVHTDYAPYKLVRTSHTVWTLSAVVFASEIDPPTSLSGTMNGVSGSFSQRYAVTSVDADGKESVASTVDTVADAKPPTEWIAEDYIDLSWTAAADAVEYNIYKESFGYYGFIGVAVGVLVFDDHNYTPDTSLTPPEANNPFSGGKHPGAVALHQQRLWLGGADANPATFNSSRTADFENFNKSRPTRDDDAMEFTLSGRIDQIKWFMPFNDLLIGTAGAEFKVHSPSGGAITPGSVDAPPQSFNGSKKLDPIMVGNSVIHVQRQGSTVRDLFYSLEKDGYVGNNLSVLADHLFDGHDIISWAYQQVPDSVVWAVRDDGVLLGMTYLKEHEIWGWHRHITDGNFKWVSVVGGSSEDRPYFLVERTIDRSTKYYIERLVEKWHEADGIKNAFYVDSGLTYDGAATTSITGLDHLEGKTVSVLADGSPVADLVVTLGAITLPFAASIVHVGLPYVGILAPLPFEMDTQTGTSQGSPRSFGQIITRLFESVGGEVGAGGLTADIDDIVFDSMHFSPAVWGQPVEPYTGVKSTSCPAGYDSGLTVYIKQEQPLPLNILSIVAEIGIDNEL